MEIMRGNDPSLKARDWHQMDGRHSALPHIGRNADSLSSLGWASLHSAAPSEATASGPLKNEGDVRIEPGARVRSLSHEPTFRRDSSPLAHYKQISYSSLPPPVPLILPPGKQPSKRQGEPLQRGGREKRNIPSVPEFRSPKKRAQGKANCRLDQTISNGEVKGPVLEKPASCGFGGVVSTLQVPPEGTNSLSKSDLDRLFVLRCLPLSERRPRTQKMKHLEATQETPI